MRFFLILLMAFCLASCGTLPTEETAKLENTADVIEPAEDLETLPESDENIIEENPSTDPDEEKSDDEPEITDEKNEEAKSKPDFGKYTENYYTEIADINVSDFYASNPILEGRTVDFEKAVKVYFVDKKYESLREETQIIAFLMDYHAKGKIWDMYSESEGDYFAMASYANEEKIGVTLKKDGDNMYVGQIGGVPRIDFPETESVYNELSEIFGSEEIKTKRVSITPFLSGILISSEDKEYVLVLEAFYDFEKAFEIDTLYPVSSIIEEIKYIYSMNLD